MNRRNMSTYILAIAFICITVGLFILVYLPYRRDIRNAYLRLETMDRQVVETACGPIEVAIRGDGAPVLVSHGISGGFDQALGLADTYLGAEYRVIAPSRFGYHGTPLPANASPAGQADAFACLLDALEIPQVTVIADSAGGTSAVQMALHHPERISALVLVSSTAPTVGESVPLPPQPVIKTVFGSDFLLWLIATHFQSAMQTTIGVPQGYSLSEEEQALVSGVIRSVLPIKPRQDGFVFDMFTSNLDMDQHGDAYPLEGISVPTLVINAVDDPLTKYENAQALVARIPHAELVTIPKGGPPSFRK